MPAKKSAKASRRRRPCISRSKSCQAALAKCRKKNTKKQFEKCLKDAMKKKLTRKKSKKPSRKSKIPKKRKE